MFYLKIFFTYRLKNSKIHYLTTSSERFRLPLSACIILSIFSFPSESLANNHECAPPKIMECINVTGYPLPAYAPPAYSPPAGPIAPFPRPPARPIYPKNKDQKNKNKTRKKECIKKYRKAERNCKRTYKVYGTGLCLYPFIQFGIGASGRLPKAFVGSAETASGVGAAAFCTTLYDKAANWCQRQAKLAIKRCK
ncbi:hypothetical protein [Microbulbifer sediminum]|uniref:hypothetical protein n=1 Tax=Microbulbifer sediminum TaxID=2904250 RepID=UPI001F2B90E3|nr:hypothetical protein [Microbulbifer sediminum]